MTIHRLPSPHGAASPHALQRPARSNGAGHATIPWPLRLQRWRYALLGRVLPDRIARQAAAQFYTVRRAKIGPAERAFLDAGKKLSLDFRGTRLRGWHWGASGPDAPQILLQHGWEGHAGQFHALASVLEAQGFGVVAFDAPGHGLSPDGEANVTIMAQMLGAIARAYGPFAAAIGHSMGGASVGIAVQRGLAVERAVHIAAPASLRRALRRFAAFMTLPPTATARLVAILGAKVDRPLGELDFERAASPPTLPLLLLHDPADREVPASEASLVAGHWPGAALRHVSGAGHRRILADARSLALIGDFLSALRCDWAHSKVS